MLGTKAGSSQTPETHRLTARCPELTPTPGCHVNTYIKKNPCIFFYRNGGFTLCIPFAAIGSAVPQRAPLLFRFQHASRGQYVDSVQQEFPVLLLLPPSPLMNSETKTTLARGYSLTSSPGGYSPNYSLYFTLKASSCFCGAQVRASHAMVGGAWMEKGSIGIKQQPLSNRPGSACTRQLVITSKEETPARGNILFPAH